MPKLKIGNVATALTVTCPLREEYSLLQGLTQDPEEELKEKLIKDVPTV